MNKLIVGTIIGLSALSLSCTNSTKPNEDNKTIITKTEEKKMKTIQLTKADFLEKVANYETNPEDWKYLGDKPALIDFYADWCGPCKAIAPVLEELAGEYEGEIYIYKIDTEEERELAGLFGIRSIPSLLFIPMGESPQMAQGAVPKPELKKAIDEILLKK
ncbi:MAG: thioredoxin [Dysgonomonas sp.]|nr:thioredoxin [Dysgonomonas sp.]